MHRHGEPTHKKFARAVERGREVDAMKGSRPMDRFRMIPGDSEAEVASRPRRPEAVSDEMTVEFEVAGVKLRATRVADENESAIPGCEHWGLSVADIHAPGVGVTPEIAETSYELIRSFERGLTTTLATDLFKVRRLA